MDKVESGANIHIPSNVGRHSSELRPIALRFSSSGSNFRFYLPGVLFAVAVLIDEESFHRDAMQAAHEDLKKLIKQRFDDFFNGFDLQPLIGQAVAQQSIAAAQQSLVNKLNAFIGNRNSGLVKEAIDAAIQSPKRPLDGTKETKMRDSHVAEEVSHG